MLSSFIKSYKLSRLQRRIRPKIGRVSDLMKSNEEAFDSFLTLCEKDSGVAFVMKEFGISKTELRGIFSDLEMSRAGQWIKGHYVALSCLAYVEPLEFYLWCKKERKISDIQLAHILVTYFSKSSGSLYRIMATSTSP